MISADYYLHLNMEYFILFFSGIIGGLIAGLLGLGGGIFYIIILPIVIQWYGIPTDHSTAFVIANSLLGISMASGTSIISSFKKLKSYLVESLMIGIPAIIISLLSTHFIVHSSFYSTRFFNAFVIVLMIFILVKMTLNIKTNSSPKHPEAKIQNFPGAISGGLAGFISALSGLGGGIIIIPILQIKFNQGVQKSKLISLVIIFLSSSILSIQNLLSSPSFFLEESNQVGYILPYIAMPLILGVFIGGPLGIKWSSRIQDKTLNKIFIVFIILILLEKSWYFL